MNIFPSRPNATSGGYRPDIDGLRAWAVISVILYHFGIAAFKGGFIGVDIFFVISGYLITKGVLSQVDKKTFSVGDFYIRRVRRLFPALFVTISITYIFCYFIFSPSDFMSMSGSTVYAITGISNIYFWLGSGYFDKFSSLKPLLHTWSLSVELQFYLIWPFLLIVFSKLGKRYVAVGITIFVVLFSVISIIHVKSDSTSSFFLTQYRMHEFAIGGIAVFIESLLVSRVKKNVFYTLGLFLVVVPVFTYNISEITFPGYFSLVPCIGAALLIISGKDISLSKILSNRIASHIGEMSYSLYLVHWPVFVFFSYFLFGKITISVIFTMSIVTLFISLLMYSLVEKPLRTTKNNKISGPAFSLCCCMCVIILIIPSSSSWANKGWEWRFSDEMKAIASIPDQDAKGFTWKKQEELAKKVDFDQGSEKPKLLILGDSQSADVINMMQEAGYLDKYNIVARTVYAECGTLYLPKNEEDEYYSSINKHTMQSPELIAACKNQTSVAMDKKLLQSADEIIISMLYLSHSPSYIARSVEEIRKSSKSKIYLFGRKEMLDNSANIVTRFGRINGVNSFAADNFKEESTYTVNSELKKIKGVEFIDMMKYVCPSDNSCNVLTDDNKPTYYDTSHLTRYGAKYFGKQVFSHL